MATRNRQAAPKFNRSQQEEENQARPSSGSCEDLSWNFQGMSKNCSTNAIPSSSASPRNDLGESKAKPRTWREIWKKYLSVNQGTEKRNDGISQTPPMFLAGLKIEATMQQQQQKRSNNYVW